MSQDFKSRSRPGLPTSSFCRQSDYVESSVQETRFKRSNCLCSVCFVCRNCTVMHCLAVCFKGGSTDRPWGKPLIVSIAECWAWTRFLQFANMKCLAVWHVKDFFEGFCHLVSSCPFAAFFSRLVWSRKDSKSGWTQGALHGSEQEMSRFGEHLGISAKTIDPLVVSMYSVSTVNIFGHFDSSALV